MNFMINSLQNGFDNEEEDYETYFLQPSKSPYNITEKVHQANIDLFNNINTAPTNMSKTTKVTFKNELTTFEPEQLTDEDINSIESEIQEIREFSENLENREFQENHQDVRQFQENRDIQHSEDFCRNQILERETAAAENKVLNLNIFEIKEEENDDVFEQEMNEDGIILDEDDGEFLDEIPLIDSNYDSSGEINSDDYHYQENDDQNNQEPSLEGNYHSVGGRIMASLSADDTRNLQFNKRRKKSNKRRSAIADFHRNSHASSPGGGAVECRHHCIEKLDFDLSMSIKKLDIKEKPSKCPLLKLQQRACCDENKARNPANLPCYNGFRSEYGLSSAELERREKRRELIRLRAQKRQQLMEEYKNRKNQQNEEVFCQWLREVTRRKGVRSHGQPKSYSQAIDENKCGSASGKGSNSNNNINNNKQPLSPNVINFPTARVVSRDSSEPIRALSNERPKTANNEFVPKQGVKRTKRPRTSPACVFIEVPQKILEKGIRVGDMLVTKSNFVSKKMHILAVSS